MSSPTIQVINVLKQALSAPFTNSIPVWNPPPGYEVRESFPRYQDTLFASSCCTAIAWLTKVNHSTPGRDFGDTSNLASWSGRLHEEDVIVPASRAVEACNEMDSSINDLLCKAAALRNIVHLEAKLNQPSQSSSPEPPAKKPRLNGMSHKTTQSPNKVDDLLLRDELLALSLKFQIPSTVTQFKSTEDNLSEQIGEIVVPQRTALKRPESQDSAPTSQNSSPGHQTSAHRVSQRKRKRSKVVSLSSSISSSLTALASDTVGALGGVVKTAVYLGTLGLVNMDSMEGQPDNLGVEERIEDQAYNEDKESRIHWNESHQLIFPTFYYEPSSGGEDGKITVNSKVSQDIDTTPRHSSKEIISERSTIQNSEELVGDGLGDIKDCIEFPRQDLNGSEPPVPLLPPSSYLPLVLLQQVSGRWELSTALCQATGIPMAAFKSLPTLTNQSTFPSSSPPLSNDRTKIETTQCMLSRYCWPTVIAVSCLKELFVDTSMEWELVVFKGETWLQSTDDLSSVTYQQMFEISKNLFRK